MSELVQRLRGAVHEVGTQCTRFVPLLLEAVDEIERLTLANESLERDRFWWLGEDGRSQRERTLQTRLAAAEKVVEAARAKLKKITYADGTGGHDEAVCRAIYSENAACSCGTDDLRAALDAADLNSAKEGE